MEALLILCFSVRDLLQFYICFESVLIPMFIIIGVWGSRERKVRAAYMFFLYTLIGSVLMLLSILYIYFKVGTTDYESLLAYDFNDIEQRFIFLAFFASFASKIPMLPVVLGKSTTISYIKRYSYLLYVTSLLPFLFGFSGQIYLAFSVVLSSVFVFKAYMLKKNDDIKAKGLFRYSIFYLFLIFFILVIDKFILLNFNFI